MNNLIKSIRSKLNMNQEQFAKELGTTVLSINRWENEKTSPNKMAQNQIYRFYKEHKLELSDMIVTSLSRIPNENGIILYHGSKQGIKNKIAPISRNRCDFGKGFYLGTNPLQPLTLICNEDNPIFYTFSLDLNNLRTLKVNTDLDWAMIIAFYRGYLDGNKESDLYRRLESMTDGYDVIIGPIADDRMYRVLNSFFEGEITDQALLHSLSALDLGVQYVCKSQNACEHLKILEERKLSNLELEILRDKSIARRKEGIQSTEEILRLYRRKGRYFDEILEGESYE
jgi:transcriptional regulator with XRE-family HTH domain